MCSFSTIFRLLFGEKKILSVVEDGMKLKLFVKSQYLLIEDRTYLFQIASKVLPTEVWMIFTRGRNCWLDSVHLKFGRFCCLSWFCGLFCPWHSTDPGRAVWAQWSDLY